MTKSTMLKFIVEHLPIQDKEYFLYTQEKDEDKMIGVVKREKFAGDMCYTVSINGKTIVTNNIKKVGEFAKETCSQYKGNLTTHKRPSTSRVYDNDYDWQW